MITVLILYKCVAVCCSVLQCVAVQHLYSLSAPSTHARATVRTHAWACAISYSRLISFRSFRFSTLSILFYSHSIVFYCQLCSPNLLFLDSQRLVSYSILNSQYLCSFCVYICIFSCAHRHRHRHRFRFLTPSFLFCSLSILFCSLSISFCSLNILFYSLNILFCSLSILFSAQNRTRHVRASV